MTTLHSMKRPHWLKLSPPMVFGLATVGVLGLVWAVVYLPRLQTAPLSQKIKGYEKSSNPDPEKLATLEKGRIDSENAIRAGLIQGLGGTAVLIGIYFTYRNLKVAEDKQVTERFGKAVEMLSSDSLHTRLGGIYALERIANDSDKDYWQVMEVLTAFVREESPWPPKTEKTESEGATAEAKGADPVALPQPAAAVSAAPSLYQRLKEREDRLAKLSLLRTDIQAIMTVIGRRKHHYEEGETQRLDLSKTDLRKLQAHRANLTGVELKGAHLEYAYLGEAHLEHAFLKEAHLEDAKLWSAHLKHAEMSKAHLENANLIDAHLEDASLIDAHLEDANLWGVDLSQVHGLTQAQLDSVYIDKDTKLPPDLHRPEQPWETATPTPSTPPPPNPPAAPSTANAPPSTATPEPNAEPQPPAT